jgi:hypothetical protein
LHAGPPVDLWYDSTGFDLAALGEDFGLDALDVEVHVDAIGHRLWVGVLADQILSKEPEGLLARCGSQPRDVRLASG